MNNNILSTKELESIFKNLKVLYVEDETSTRELMLDVLNIFFNDITLASDGEKALELYYNNSFDLIITDLEMPNISGIKFIEEIREKNINIPIIVLTGHTDPEYLMSCANMSTQAYIVKPIELKRIKEALFKMSKYFERKNIQVDITKTIFFNSNDRLVYDNDIEIKLTKKERELLTLLIQNQNNLLNYDEIENKIWYINDEIMTSLALRTVIKSLRKKITGINIQNISGSGYKLIIN